MNKCLLCTLLLFIITTNLYSQEKSSTDTSLGAFSKFVSEINRFEIIVEDGDIEVCRQSSDFKLNSDNEFFRTKYINVDTNICNPGYTDNCRCPWDLYKITIDRSIITTYLLNIYKNKNVVPNIEDFHFSQSDKQEYLTIVEKYAHYNEDGSEKNIDRAQLRNFLNTLDTISQATLYNIFNKREFGYYSISIVFHSDSDSFILANEHNEIFTPWLLPYSCQFKNCTFKTYDVAFGKYISTIVPSELRHFRGCLQFTNADILFIMAFHFLYPTSFGPHFHYKGY